MTINKLQIIRTFRRLHHAACHSPHASVRKKYRTVYRKWHHTHFPKNASARYSNTWSLDAWL